MSEKIYALLFRLHSAHFRAAYGEEALQLVRDRAWDEKGFFASLRLWLDLLADLVCSVPLGYRDFRPHPIGAPGRGQLDGTPSFISLGGESPRYGAFLVGGFLSLGMLTAFPASISHFESAPKPLLAQASSGLPRPPAPARDPVQLDASERQRVVQAVIANVRDHYIDQAIARQIGDALLAHQKNGDYDEVTDGAAFANLLTTQLRDVAMTCIWT